MIRARAFSIMTESAGRARGATATLTAAAVWAQFEALDPTRVMNRVLTHINLWVILTACMLYFVSELIAIRKVYGGLKYELNHAHKVLAETILVQSEKTQEAFEMRNAVEMDFMLHTLLDEAERLAHGGHKAVEKYRKKHHLDQDDHGNITAKIDDSITYRCIRNNHIEFTTAEKLPKLLRSGAITPDTLVWRLGMPLHAAPLRECEEYFDTEMLMARHVVEQCPELASSSFDPSHPLAQPSKSDAPEMLVHDRLSLAREERKRLTQERARCLEVRDMEQLMDVITGLDAVEAYEKLITGNELLPLEELQGGGGGEESDSRFTRGVVFENPLDPSEDSEDPADPTSTAAAEETGSWWQSGDPIPFAGASMVARQAVGMYSSPDCKHHKGTLKKGHAFAVITIQELPQSTVRLTAAKGEPELDDGASGTKTETVGMLEIMLPKNRKIAWIHPLGLDGEPLIEMNIGTFAKQGSTVDQSNLRQTKATAHGTQFADHGDDAGGGDSFEVAEMAQVGRALGALS